MIKKKLIVTIDGPGAAGKGTIAFLLARRFGFLDIDSGALFRAITWLVLQKGIPIDQKHEQVIASMIAKHTISLMEMDGATLRMGVMVDDHDVSSAIRTEALGRVVPSISALAAVREIVEKLQHSLAGSTPNGVVIEGRDTGTVVFPQAQIKVFLTASPEERAQRRHAELVEKGKDVTFEAVYSDLVARDQADIERTLSPLTKPKGALVIDSTNLHIDQVVDRISRLIEAELS